MTNEEIMKLLKEHEERKASGKPFTDEEYAEADAEDKAKIDDYADFCAYLAEREAMDEEELDEEGYFIEPSSPGSSHSGFTVTISPRLICRSVMLSCVCVLL